MYHRFLWWVHKFFLIPSFQIPLVLAFYFLLTPTFHKCMLPLVSLVLGTSVAWISWSVIYFWIGVPSCCHLKYTIPFCWLGDHRRLRLARILSHGHRKLLLKLAASKGVPLCRHCTQGRCLTIFVQVVLLTQSVLRGKTLLSLCGNTVKPILRSQKYLTAVVNHDIWLPLLEWLNFFCVRTVAEGIHHARGSHDLEHIFVTNCILRINFATPCGSKDIY
jgi:hypothetical protein